MPKKPENYLIDTHCHVHDTTCFKLNPEETLERAREKNVRQAIVIGTSHADSLAARAFAETRPDVFWAYGIHPSEASAYAKNPPRWRPDASEKLVAIGEVGLDYHYTPFDKNQQFKLLEDMLALAKTLDLPLIFHVREAFPDFFPLVDNAHVTRAVVHSFSDNRKNLEKCLERGFYVGVNGLATFATLPTPPLDRILLETDAPYLTPKPFRGKINEPAYIAEIAAWLAIKLGVSVDEVAEQTTKNARNLFRIEHPVLRPA